MPPSEPTARPDSFSHPRDVGTVRELLDELESLSRTHCQRESGPPRCNGHAGEFPACESYSCRRRQALLADWGRSVR